MDEPVQMLVWEDSRPLPGWWPRFLLRSAEHAMRDYVKRRVDQAGGELTSDVLTTSRQVDGRWLVRAEAYALCPPGAATDPDIVEREENP